MPLKAFIVEDSPSIREGLTEALAEMAGIETCGHAATERDALAWLSVDSNEWDIAIVDLILEAGGSGLAVLRTLRGHAPGRKVVVLTATASKAVRDVCLNLGCDRVFDKQMETDALIEWCRQQTQAQRSAPTA